MRGTPAGGHGVRGGEAGGCGRGDTQPFVAAATVTCPRAHEMKPTRHQNCHQFRLDGSSVDTTWCVFCNRGLFVRTSFISKNAPHGIAGGHGVRGGAAGGSGRDSARRPPLELSSAYHPLARGSGHAQVCKTQNPAT